MLSVVIVVSLQFWKGRLVVVHSLGLWFIFKSIVYQNEAAVTLLSVLLSFVCLKLLLKIFVLESSFCGSIKSY